MGNNLFRQQALETLESPEKLTDHIRVTGPSFHLWLTSILICVIAACVWLANSTISDFVKINGVAFPHQKISSVSAPLEGRITEVYVKKGDHVKQGDLLFRYTTGESVREMRSTHTGVILSHKVQQETFNALEPCAYLLPYEQVNRLKEIVAFVTYADLRKLKVGMEVQVTPTDLKREEVGYMYGRITAINELPTSAKEAAALFKIEEFSTAIFPEEAAFMVQIKLEDHPEHPDQIRWSHQSGERINIKIGTFCDLQIITRQRPAYELLFNL